MAIPNTTKSAARKTYSPVLVVLICLHIATQYSSAASPDPAKVQESVRGFTERSNNLHLNSRTASELNGLINEYEELISKSKSLAGVEWAMWDLARLYSSNNDANANPVGDSLNKSIEWYRRAAAIAPSGGGLWRECQFGLVAQLHRKLELSVPSNRGSLSSLVSKRDRERMLSSTRKIIEDLNRRFPREPSVQLRCRQCLVAQLIAEHELSNAEELVYEILRIESFDPPELLRACKASSVNAFLHSVLKQQGESGVSDERLQGFVDDFPNDQDVQQAVQMVRGMRSGWTAPMVYDAEGNEHQTTFLPSSRYLIAGNALILAGIVAVTVCRHVFKR